MSGFSASDVLELWELAQAGPDRLARALLARALPGLDADQRAALPLGTRDAALIDLRVQWFGPIAHARATCPMCQQALELELELTAVRVHTPPPTGVLVERGPLRLELHCPSADDVAAVADEPDPARALLARCARSMTLHGAPCSVDDVDDDALAEAAHRLAEQDPQADLDLAFTCPACDHAWLAGLDILGFHAAELRAHAVRIAREVDTLARTYHWREADILAMTPARRHLYLGLAGA